MRTALFWVVTQQVPLINALKTQKNAFLICFMAEAPNHAFDILSSEFVKENQCFQLIY
jgi:hypothetical protein